MRYLGGLSAHISRELDVQELCEQRRRLDAGVDYFMPSTSYDYRSQLFPVSTNNDDLSAEQLPLLSPKLEILQKAIDIFKGVAVKH